MQFGKAVGAACSSFAVTNIDDLFVLVTFFTEASTSKVVTPWKITLGQYIGFTVIIIISMIGFGVSFVLPAEPIGFLGLLPILLGTWKIFGLFLDKEVEEEQVSLVGSLKSVLKVSAVTLMNGGDNIGTYIPLFSQAKGAEIAVYVVVYYILVGVWCLAAFLILRQRHILYVAQKYARLVIPFLYVGLGTFIIVKSECYPWSIEHIDDSTPTNLGQTVLAVVTTALLLACMGIILWLKLKKKKREQAAPNDDIFLETGRSSGEASVPSSVSDVDSGHGGTNITIP